MVSSCRWVAVASVALIATVVPPGANAQDQDADPRAVAERFLADVCPIECAIADHGPTERADVFTLSGWDVGEVGRVVVDRSQGVVNHYSVTRPPWAVGPSACPWVQIEEAALHVASKVGYEAPQGWDLGVQWAVAKDTDGGVDLLVGGVRRLGRFAVHHPSRVTLTIASDTARLLSLSWVSEQTDPLDPACPQLAAVSEVEQTVCERIGAGPSSLVFGPMQWLGESDADGVWFATVFPAADAPAGLCAAQVSLSTAGELGVVALPQPPDADRRAALAALQVAAAVDQAAWARSTLEHHGYVEDTLPVWMPGRRELMLRTVRRTIGVAPWLRAETVGLCPLGEETLLCVAPSWTRQAASLSVAGSTLAQTTSDGAVHLVDLATGRSFHAWGPASQATCAQAVLSASASHITYSARRRHGDQDIFVDMIDWDAGHLADHRRIVRVDGLDERPTFSPDGEWVYYVHSEGGPWSLCRVRADVPHHNSEVETLLEGFGKVGRMSFFPDGQRLLVWHEGGLDVVDVEAHTKEPLGLPALHDPDLPGGPELKLQDPVVSPDGTQLAFSGYRDGEGADGYSGWYIYVCGIDGSNVERVTPLEDDPIDFYVFPKSGRSAFDIEKELILERERE
jgi:hypothetical protein